MPWLVLVLVVAIVLGAEGVVGSDDLTPAVDGDAPDRGFYPVAPARLAALAGVPLDVYTLARVIGSESDGHSSEAEKLAIGWVTLNQVRAWNAELTEAVTRGTKGQGFYGAQNSGRRWISSRFRPQGGHLELADNILNGVVVSLPDNTGGATKFLHVATQQVLHERDPAGTDHPQEVIDRWRDDGFEPRAIPGVSPSRFLVFVPRGVA